VALRGHRLVDHPAVGQPDGARRAELVTYLASDAASLVTGQRITVNGGQTVT